VIPVLRPTQQDGLGSLDRQYVIATLAEVRMRRDLRPSWLDRYKRSMIVTAESNGGLVLVVRLVTKSISIVVRDLRSCG